MSESVANNQTDRQASTSGFVWELLRTGLIVLLIVLPIRLFVAQPFIVSGASMQPTFSSGDYLIIDQLSYRFDTPQRHDVAVFRYPNNPSKFYIKRVIGLPGETVNIDDGTVEITNNSNPDGFVVQQPYLSTSTPDNTNLSVTLQNNEYFVLGDNRESSSDSRSWGPLPERFLVGHAALQLLPFGEVETQPGNVTLSAEP